MPGQGKADKFAFLTASSTVSGKALRKRRTWPGSIGLGLGRAAHILFGIRVQRDIAGFLGVEFRAVE